MVPISNIIRTIFAISLVFGMLGPVAAPAPSVDLPIHPQIGQIASENPDQLIAVIIQKADRSKQAEQVVEQLGGTITKDLHIINAIAAELPAGQVARLIQLASVSWVSLDGPVKPAGKPVANTAILTVRDEFSDALYSNNDGTAGWKTEWVEVDIAGEGPTAGNVLIQNGELMLKDQPDTGTQPSIERAVNLSDGVVSAVLTFSYRVGPGVDAGEDLIVLEISKDAGLSYTTLTTFNHSAGTTGTYNRDILAYAAADTRIRLRVLNNYGGSDEYFAVDNLQIEFKGNALPRNTFIETLNVDDVWKLGLTGSGVGVAIIDSGITKEKDLGQSVIAQMSYNSNSTTVLDKYGHGTHVAGIIAMNGSGSGGVYNGIAPGVNLFSLKVNDDTGMAYESDVVEALQWVYDNKARYNLRVVNISINSTVAQSYHTSPLNAAAEILWFNGIVVIASAGNYWTGETFNPIQAAPANDPFIITVGATDEKGTAKTRDDVIANYSSFGTTLDGYFKPDIYAPGTSIISLLASSSDWDLIAPERVIAGKYFRLSGTSMAAPMVTGAVALLLQDEPNLTPDQVKHRLISSADWIGPSKYLNVFSAVTQNTTASANTGLTASQLLWSGSDPVAWDSVSWNSVSWNSVSWNSVSWNSVSWNSVSWNSAFWGE